MYKSGASIVVEETLNGYNLRRKLDQLLASAGSNKDTKMSKSGFSIVVEETLSRLDSLIMTDETVIGSNLRRELDRLLVLRSEARIVLQTAEEKHNIAGDLRGYHMVSYWLNNLKEAAFKAEDLIDELAYQILLPKVTNLWFNNLLFNVKLSHRVGVLNQSFDKIKYEIRNISLDRRIPSRAMDGVTDHSVLFDNQIIGREADVSKIVNLLTRSSDQQVVPIVGMAGLGKTALAKFVSRQVMALNLFDVKMWVCVSEKCDEQQILGQMSRYLKKDAIFEQLGKELERKRFLLVLDDVWGDVSSWWDDFRTRLLKICKHNEIAVLVTTRYEQVASVVETSSQHRHKLDVLSDEECWFILKERAFRNAKVQPNLEAIGRKIAKKCRGVSLAAKALGGTLGFNCWDEGTRDINYMIERAWVQIRDSYFFREIRNDESNVKLILQLCFRDLPLSLKKCFALCSVFPKGFLFIKEDLIHLWMAERLADSYDIGNEYFHALLANSFFQDAESDDDGNVLKCKMLNSGPDLVLYIEKFEFEIPRKYLYVDYQSITTSEALPENMAEYLSTIILNGAPFQSFWNLKRLRTLYLNDVDMKILPSAINKSKHLKYLHVSYTKISPLPKSISEMYMLQILTLSNCSCEHLPFLGGLPYLKFLKISHMDRVKVIGNESYEGNSSEQHDQLRLFPALKSLSLSWMENLVAWTPPSHGNTVVIFPLLQNLSIRCCAKLTGFPMRDLSTLVKGEFKDCEELRFIFGEHKSFPFVTSLSIVGCPKLTYLRNWLLSNKSYKEFRVRRCEWLKFVPDDLGMQRSLVSLQIYCCKRLGSFSEEILCKLTQLKKLSIGAFSEKLDDFCYLNRIKDLMCLKELEIWGSDVFGRNMSALPNQLQHLDGLQSLKIKGFTAMEALPEWLGDLQSLETISLNYCWHLKNQSTVAFIQRLSNLSHVYIYGCRALEEHKSQWMDFSGTSKVRIFFL